MRERLILSRRAFVEIVVWKLPKPLPDSKHTFKRSIWPTSPIIVVCFVSTTKRPKAITSIWVRLRHPIYLETSKRYKRIFGLQ